MGKSTIVALLVGGVLLLTSWAGRAQQPATPLPAVPVDAVTAIIEAYKTHSIVTLPDWHGDQQLLDLLRRAAARSIRARGVSRYARRSFLELILADFLIGQIPQRLLILEGEDVDGREAGLVAHPFDPYRRPTEIEQSALVTDA